MSNSSLINYTVLSPNNSGLRTHKIDRITPHCVVGQFDSKSVAELFVKPERQASANYIIGTKGDITLSVDENKRSWCSSSKANDQRAVTIECASDKVAPYTFNSTVYNKLIELCTDICKRNGKKKLLWIEDKTKALAYEPKSDEMLLTVHRWFAATACPGDWMFGKMGDLASKVTKKLGGTTSNSTSTSTPKNTSTTYTEGEVIKLKAGAKYTSGKVIPDWIFNSTLYYRGKNNEGIIFSTLKVGAITGVTAETNVEKVSTFKAYQAQVTADTLNVRKGPSTGYDITTTIKKNEIYTIVEECNNWGKLKSGAGWISLKYTKKV